MTNYTTFPSWRAHYGITIKFNERRYSWTTESESQRKYLLTSSYLDGADSIYIGKYKVWLSVDEFKRYCSDEDYRANLKNTSLTHTQSITNEVCPQCGGLLEQKNGKFGPFIGCKNYPVCKYTMKAITKPK